MTRPNRDGRNELWLRSYAMQMWTEQVHAKKYLKKLIKLMISVDCQAFEIEHRALRSR